MSDVYEKKVRRIGDAVALKEPDRIPFIPSFGQSYANFSGATNYDAMMDPRVLKPGIEHYLKKYEVDLFMAPATYPANILEMLGTEFIKWPGPSSGLPLNSGFQIVDKTYLQEDEYDCFIADPTAFIMTRVYPSYHKNLRGLSKLVLNDVLGGGHFISMSCFADEEVRDALLTLMQAGKDVQKWGKAMAELSEVAKECDTPGFNGGGCTTAYDAFADHIRGYINVPMDLFVCPEKVMAAVEAMDIFVKRAIDQAYEAGMKRFFIPLHGGSDDFMSDETYRKYYWPFLQRMIERIVAHEMTPFILTEGNYNTRLEVLRDIPKGKVVYMFEKVDIAQAKKILGDVACICGNLNTTDLMYGTKEHVIDTTKRMIDACAPGGGFIMNTSSGLDFFKEELFDAWYETTLKYGAR